MLARTACATSVSDRASCDAERSGSTAGRIRSTIARNPGDWSGVGRRSSSMVVTIAPHAVCPSTTDRKSTRLNSSHLVISYAVFCLKKKKKNNILNERVNKIEKHYVNISQSNRS